MIELLSRTVLMGTPLLYGSLSEVYSERSGVMRWSYPVLLLFVILLVPLVPVLLALSFESRRWAESSYGKEDA